MKKILGKNRLFLMLFVAMIFAFSFASLSGAADAVPYLDADGKTQSCSDYTVVTEEMTELENGWYVVSSSVSTSERITVTGDVHLIIVDGAEYKTKACIAVEAGNSLTIYAQSKPAMDEADLYNVDENSNTGKLTVSGGLSSNGIGSETAACGNITINGGIIDVARNVNGSSGIGIGGASGFTDGIITINGGFVKSHAIIYAFCGFVTINGGTVRAYSTGENAFSSTPTFGKEYYHRVAVGRNNSNVKETPYSEITEDTFKQVLVRIRECGADEHENYYDFTYTRHTEICKWCNYSVEEEHSLNADKECTVCGGVRVNQYYYNDEKDKIDEKGVISYPLTSETTEWKKSFHTYYLAKGDVTISSAVAVEGDVTLILAEGATLNVKGINVGEGCKLTITICVGSDGENVGKLESGGSRQPGISGKGDIEIIGGNITAKGSTGYAGIGGVTGDAGTITIRGGIINATGGSSSAGIGGGRNGSGGTINIYGGTITANGSSSAAGIGGGDKGSGGIINIYGGTITANGGSSAAGIGDGRSGSGAVITIKNATVSSFGGKAFSAIPNLDDTCFWEVQTGTSLDELAIAETFTAEEFTSTMAVSVRPMTVYEAIKFLKHDGFQLRMTQYNGLRTRFVVDLAEFNALTEKGYTVVEYGTLVSAASKLASGEMPTISKNSEGNYAAQSFVQKIAVYDSVNGYKEKYTEMTEEQIVYYVTVTKFDIDTYAREIVARGYMVVSDSAGNEYVIYADYPNEAYRSISLKKLCEDMAAAGSLSAEECISYADVLKFKQSLQES